MSRRAAVLAAVVVLAGAIGAWAVQRLSGRVELPPPPPRTAHRTPSVSLDDFAGAEACRNCHAEQYGAWASSTHGRAGGPPSRDLVISRFDGRPIRFRDAVVIPSVTAGGEYTFRVSQQGRADVVLSVAGVIGGGHMVGGGTQGFVTAWADGTYRFLPFDFARRDGTWFCNTIGRADRGWVPIMPELPIAACSDWPPARVLGTEAIFSNCQECHGSQVQLRLDPQAKRYDTQFASLRINCESCHGPAQAHATLARSGALDTAQTIGLRSLAALPKDASLGVCFECHSLKDVLNEDYLPGMRLEAYYSLAFPLLGDEPFFADGRVRTFAYQEGHRWSDCYLNGSMTCTDCHQPHGQGYRDVWGTRLPDRFADGQCLGCHASKAEPVEAHTRHAPGSAGSRCVACHMPYLQQPELGTAIRYARSDHAIAIPRPAFDAQLGIRGACQQCHEGDGRYPLSVVGIQEAVQQWWGELKPHPELVRTVLAGGAVGAAGAAELLRPDLDHPMAQVAALGRLLERLEPDMASFDRQVRDRLELLAKAKNLDVRALALAALHFAAGERSSVRRFLARTLGAQGDDAPLVRDRWKVALAFLADRYRERGDARLAQTTYAKALEVVPEDPRVLLNLGLALESAGNSSAAVDAYRRSLAADPAQPLTLVNLGVALDRVSDPAGSVDAYRAALNLDPRQPLALVNLANTYLRRGQVAEAIPYYRQAIAADPGIPLAHFNLARALVAAGDLRAALAEVRWGLEFAPEDAEGQQMVAELERALRVGEALR